MTAEYNVITSVSIHLWGVQWRVLTTCWYENKCDTRSPETCHILIQPIYAMVIKIDTYPASQNNW